MDVIYVLVAVVWLALAPGGVASAAPQKYANPQDQRVQLSRSLNDAIQAGDTDRFAQLVEAGARVGKDNDEFLLYVVSQRETPTVGMVELLLAKGAHVNQNVRYKTALMHAASEGHLDIAQLLIAKGAEVNAQTDEGTPLMMAVLRGDPKLVKLMLDNGADLKAKHRTGSTPLIMSAGPSFLEMNAKPQDPPPVSSSEVMSLLLAKGADPNDVGSYGRTALMAANSVTKI